MWHHRVAVEEFGLQTWNHKKTNMKPFILRAQITNNSLQQINELVRTNNLFFSHTFRSLIKVK